DGQRRLRSANKTHGARLRLPLQGADQGPLDEVSLYEGIDQQQRHAGDDDQGVLEEVDQILAHELGLNVAGHVQVGLVLHSDRAQDELQLIEIPVRQVDQGVEVAVPVGDGVEEGVDGDNGTGEGQHDVPQEPEVAAAVELSRLQELIGERGL